ncbi:MAG: hypothetical protein JWO19_268 [Bryobacterales bacterium]|nr:hypothetical protein [Bryobacterales bacterium]
MRRTAIYPHRSIRSLPLNTGRLLAALGFAIALTALVYWARAPLLARHNQISAALLRLCNIPLEGSTQVDVFEPIGSAEVVTTTAFRLDRQPIRVAILFVSAVVALLAVYRGVELARNFVVFLLVLLMLGAGVMVFAPGSEITSAEFSQIWLRGELLVWLLLPWFSAGLLVMLQPEAWPGLMWAVLMQAYGFVWSAIRLAFCLGVLHYSGLLFMPLLWFTLGLLADVLYVVVFFSLSTHVAGLRVWGRRTYWQF